MAKLKALPSTFSLEIQEHFFTAGDVDYVVVEAPGQVAAAYRNKILQGASLSKDGKIEEVRDLGATDIYLLSQCLFEITTHTPEEGKSGRKAVSAKTLGTWPQRVIEPLVEWVKEVSEINADDEEEEPEGNCPTKSTEDGSD